jgi:hypothetical protein
MRWLLRCCLIELVPSSTIGPMNSRPSGALVVACGVLAAASMTAAVYFGGTGRVPFAMIGTTLFVLLGGLTFELARRRSV